MVDSQVLRRLDFPAYCVKLLDNGLLAIAGGGGTAKTGVGNSIELGFLEYSGEQASGAYSASFKLIHKFETHDAIMKFVSFTCEPDSPSQHHRSRLNSESKHNSIGTSTTAAAYHISDLYLAGALDNSIEIFKIEPSVEKVSDSNPTEYRASATVRNVAAIQLNENASNIPNSPTAQHAEAITSLQVCPMNKPLTSSNRKASSSSSSSNSDHHRTNSVLICAGTTKGSIIIWSLHVERTGAVNFQKVHTFAQAHGSAEIDGLEVNTLGSENEHEHHLLSIGKDHKCMLWSLDRLTKLNELLYTKDKSLRMRYARFSPLFLYTIYVPRVRGGTKDVCSYLQRWSWHPATDGGASSSGGKRKPSTADSTNATRVVYKAEGVCAIKSIVTGIKVSRDGLFVCLGDCEGKIYLFDFAFTKLVDFKRQHSSVITDLAFYHDQSLAESTSADGSRKPIDLNKLIVSISIDRTLQLYKFINSSSAQVNTFLARLEASQLADIVPPGSRVGVGGAGGVLSLVSCCFSMNFFKLNLIVLLFAILFVYFFVYVETSKVEFIE